MTAKKTTKTATKSAAEPASGSPEAAFLEFLDSATRRVDAALTRLLPRDSTRPPVIHRSMRYTTLAAGKRLRPGLVLLAHEACGGRGAGAETTAAAVEMVHAFSLIHDDLPGMDDDDMRRGKPSNHVVFGEGVAILAGDALLTLAFRTLSALGGDRQVGPVVALQLVEELAEATGSHGVIGGQVLDLLSEGKEVPRSVVDYIHRQKTARLFVASLRLGGLTARAKPAALARLSRYGEAVGTAFQVVDDILGDSGTFRELGRDPGRDRVRGKVTYPKVVGPKGAHRAVDRLLAKARQEVPGFGSYAGHFEGVLAMLDRRRRALDGTPLGVEEVA